MKTKTLLLLSLFFSLPGFFIQAKSQVNQNDSLALVDLYNSTNGPNWNNHTNWLTGPVKTWYGITVKRGRVTEIKLPVNNLSGSLPASMGNLTKLNYLFISLSDLSGGGIPSSFGQMSDMESMTLLKCSIPGTIPPELGNLNKLKTLSLEGNQLTGTLPLSFGNLTNLQQIYFASNQISGPIPDTFGNLKKLVTLSGSYNNITALPSTLGNMTELTSIYLNLNKITAIPPGIGNLKKLNKVWLRDNLINSIPDDISACDDLYYLDLGKNKIATLPVSFGNFLILKVLNLEHNKLTRIPKTLGNITTLGTLWLNNNLLTQLPAELGQLTNLSTFNIRYNQLTRIPSGIFKIPALYDFLADHNQLTSLPASLFQASNLHSFDISYNNINARLSSRFNATNFPALRSFDLSHNQFHGPIHSNVANMPLNRINISSNQFTFAGMEELVNGIYNTFYTPQASINIKSYSGNGLTVSAGGTLSNNTYKWINTDDGTSQLIAGDSVYYPAASGHYTVEVTNSIATALTLKSDTVSYTMLQFAPVKQNPQQSPNEETSFSIYPNPATNYIQVQTPKPAVFILTDANGKKLQEIQIQHSGTIDIAALPAGTYFLQNMNTGMVKKIMKMNR